MSSATALRLALLVVTLSLWVACDEGSAASSKSRAPIPTPAEAGVAGETSGPRSFIRGGTTIAADASRLFADLRFLAADERGGRAPCSAGSAEVRRFISQRLADLGVAPTRRDAATRGFEHAVELRRLAECTRGYNLVGTIAAQQAGGPGSIVLSAHYDHLGSRDGEVMNGADDNASGVAALLEIARLARERPLENRLVLAFFDAEEHGLQGARAFVSAPPVPRDEIRLAVNLDMVSRHEGGGLWIAGTFHNPALRPIIERRAADLPLPIRFGHDRPEDGAEDWTLQSDHGEFHRRGIPFLYFGVDDHPDYHRASDDVEHIDPDFFAASVSTIWRVLREVDQELAETARLREESGQ